MRCVIAIACLVAGTAYANCQVNANKYGVNEAQAEAIYSAADKYGGDTFPKASDLLAISIVESKLKPDAVSSGNIGLMQVNLRAHRKHTTRKELLTVDGAIKQGSRILREYYQSLKSESKAILAYNSGIGSFLHGAAKKQYLVKYKAALREVTCTKPQPETLNGDTQ